MVLEINKHKKILLDILMDIYSNTDISGSLGFKGGTSAMLFYNLDRFSVDLEFDLLNHNKEKIVYSRLKEIAEKHGIIRENYRKKNTIIFVISYGEREQNIKIEVSLRNFGSKYLKIDFLGVPMLVMVKEDMFAHKLVAMTERMGKASRDIYDVWFFLDKNWPLNIKMLEKRTKIKPWTFLEKAAEEIKRFPSKNILSGIGELLDNKKKAWIKKNLVAETSKRLLVLKESIDRNA